MNFTCTCCFICYPSSFSSPSVLNSNTNSDAGILHSSNIPCSVFSFSAVRCWPSIMSRSSVPGRIFDTILPKKWFLHCIVIEDVLRSNASKVSVIAFVSALQIYYFNFILSLVLCCFCLSFISFSLSCRVNFSGS